MQPTANPYICIIEPARSIVPPRIILGIDPGTNIMGYGIIEIVGNKPKLLSLGVIQLGKLEDHAQKLKSIFDRTTALITGFNPTEVAIEAPFYGKNVQSMLKLGRAQGVAIAAALNMNLPVYEYEPKKIKLSIAGSGAASKEQVAAMLQMEFGLEELPKNLDATDGLAAAACHFYQSSPKPFGVKKAASGWKQFLQENPGKIKK